MCIDELDLPSEEIRNPNNLVIVHQNIRSLRSNFDKFLVEIQSWYRLPDIIILTEIWVKSDEIHLYSLPNFKAIYKCN